MIWLFFIYLNWLKVILFISAAVDNIYLIFFEIQNQILSSQADVHDKNPVI